MLKTANLSKNLLILIGITEKDEVIDGNRSSKTNGNFSRS